MITRPNYKLICLRLLLALGCLTLSVQAQMPLTIKANPFRGIVPVEQEQNAFKPWRIDVMQTGWPPPNRRNSLDNSGNVYDVISSRGVSKVLKKIDESEVREIGVLLQQLNLPDTKFNKVKKGTVYDGHDWEMKITLGDTVFALRSRDFYLELPPQQQATLVALKEHLVKVGAPLFALYLQERRKQQ